MNLNTSFYTPLAFLVLDAWVIRTGSTVTKIFRATLCTLLVSKK